MRRDCLDLGLVIVCATNGLMKPGPLDTRIGEIDILGELRMILQ